jgi:hypothetical protein
MVKDLTSKSQRAVPRQDVVVDLLASLDGR